MDKRLVDLLAFDYWIPKLCPKCGAKSKVAHTRITHKSIDRERVCVKCGCEFESIEVLKNPLPE